MTATKTRKEPGYVLFLRIAEIEGPQFDLLSREWQMLENAKLD